LREELLRYLRRDIKPMHKSSNALRIALVHDSLNPCGGAERLALAMAKALKELGHSVDLYVIEATDWSRVERLTSCNRQVVDREYVLPPFKSFPTIYSRLLHWFGRDVVGHHIVKKHNYDLVIATKQILVPVFVDVLYMHFPDFLPGFDYLYYPERYLYNTMLRIYSRPLELATRALISLFKSTSYKPLILTNSRFSASIVERFLNVKAIVLYPPVNIEKYLTLSKHRDRENIVVTISRIEPMKNLDIIIDIAEEVKEARFVILGSMQSNSYYAHLMRRIRMLNLEDKIKILLNASEELKTEIIKKAKIYLHPTKYEHFGIAIVEAMAAGLIPVVHRSGGPWTDIVELGNYGFSFSSLEEARYIIQSLTQLSEGELRTIRERIVERAKTFSYDAFLDRLSTMIDNLI
jgi:glycosyltransferase involved in cell wall biosynthesis